MLQWDYEQVFKPADDDRVVCADLDKLLAIINEEPVHESRIPAGYTYFGQFIDHDLNLTVGLSALGSPVDLGKVYNKRRPSLDLESLYGAGFEDSGVLYDRRNGKFMLRDDEYLPRSTTSFRAFIPDQRNDDNMLVGGIHLLFMKLHNLVIDRLQRDGMDDPAQLFAQARKEVIHVYQDIVLHDFAKTILHPHIYQYVICDGEGKLTSSSLQQPVLPLEFPIAAFRLHAMIRPFYKLSDDAGTRPITFLIANTGVGAQATGTIPVDLAIEWSSFFSPYQGPRQPSPVFANAFSPKVVDIQEFTSHVDLVSFRGECQAGSTYRTTAAPACAMRARSSDGHAVSMINMARFTLQRGKDVGLASAQTVIHTLLCNRNTADLAARLGLATNIQHRFVARAAIPQSIKTHTPLWLFCMTEPGHCSSAWDGPTLGVLGSWLIADVLRNATLSTPLHDSSWTVANSVLRRRAPTDCSNATSPHFSMLEISNFLHSGKP